MSSALAPTDRPRRNAARHAVTLLHRYVGLSLVLFLTIAGLTGSLLAYLQPLQALLSPHLHEAPAQGAPLPLAALIERVQQQLPHAVIASYPLDLHAGQGAHFGLNPTGGALPAGADEAWVDPVSGRVLGTVNSEAFPPTRDSLMQFIYRLHYALALPGQWGTWIMGGAAVLWFVDCFVGFYLTLPRGRPLLAKWRPAWAIKRTRVNFDLHRAGGLWLWPLLGVLALSSVYFNLSREVFMPVFGLVAQTTAEPFDTRAERPPGAIPPAVVRPQEVAGIARSEAARLGWTGEAQRFYRDAPRGFYQVYFSKAPGRWATAGNSALFIDDATGELIHVRAPGGTPGDVFLQWLSDLHQAGVFGAPYRLLLCVTGVGIAALCVTGVVIWWRKRRGRHARHARHENRRRLAPTPSQPAFASASHPLRPARKEPAP